jgi:hypothetical protein
VTIDGIWDAVLDSPMGARHAQLRLESDGDRLSGELVEASSAMTVAGTIHGETLELVAAPASPSGLVRIMLYGRVTGSHISGDVEFGDRGLGTWSADRID